MQIPDLAAVLRRNHLFDSLSDGELDSLGQRFSVLVFRLGESVFGPGDPVDGFCVVYSGKARVVAEDTEGEPTTVAVLGKGDTFGEQALLDESRQEATVRAAGELVVLKLSRPDFAAFIQAHPHLRLGLEQRIHQNNEFVFLRRLGILSHLKLPEIQQLLGRIERVALEPGDVLFEEDSEGDRAFIIRSGRIRIVKGAGAQERQLALANPGDLIGEIALLYGHPRTASAVAATKALVLGLSKDDFDSVLSDSAKRQALVQQAANRLLQNETLLAASAAPADSMERAQAPAFRFVQVKTGLLARSYPFVRADTPADCGFACLEMIHQSQDHSGSRESAGRAPRSTNSKTKSLEELSRIAEERGYLSRMLRIDARQLRDVPLPAIVEGATGFAVVFEVSHDRIVVADPTAGVRVTPISAFARQWNGGILTLTRLPKTPAGRRSIGAIFGQFVPYARTFLPLLIWIGALALIGQALGLVGPLLNKAIIDQVLVTGDRQFLYLLLCGLLLATAFQMATGSLREILVAHVMRRVTALTQLRFFTHILSLPQRIVSTWRVGDFVVRFEENEKLLQLVAQSGFQILVDTGTIFVLIFALVTMSPKLAVVTVAFVFAYGLLMIFMSPRLRANDREVFERRKEAESYFIEAISGIHTIKSLAMEPGALRRGEDLILGLKTSEFRGAWLGFGLGQASSLLSGAATVAVLGYGAHLALAGEITTGALVASNAMLGATLAPVRGLAGVWDEIQEIRVAFERTTDVLRLETEDAPQDAVRSVIQGHLSVRNLTFQFPGKPEPVLSDINLDVLPGQRIAIVGRSGSGKTTLASLLTGLYSPTSGAILLDQVELSNVDHSAYRRQIGIVEQQPFLFSGTIRENIAKADPSKSLDSVVVAATLAGAHEFIDQLPMGYDTQIGERGMTLSGGQKQRLAIARAILNNPRMLVFDEATSALDTESERVIQKNLDTILAGKTALIIAHRLSTVRNADRIVVLDQGRIVESGSHAELMEQRGLYFYLNSSTN